jgi:hypothetical protein
MVKKSNQGKIKASINLIINIPIRYALLRS